MVRSVELCPWLPHAHRQPALLSALAPACSPVGRNKTASDYLPTEGQRCLSALDKGSQVKSTQRAVTMASVSPRTLRPESRMTCQDHKAGKCQPGASRPGLSYGKTHAFNDGGDCGLAFLGC